MRIVDAALLRKFHKTRCEYCGKAAPCDPHHIFSRGSGRIDLAINLLSLCRRCHSFVHAGGYEEDYSVITRQDLLEIVSRRENVPVDWIVDELNRIRNLPKGSEPHEDQPQTGEGPGDQGPEEAEGQQGIRF